MGCLGSIILLVALVHFFGWWGVLLYLGIDLMIAGCR